MHCYSLVVGTLFQMWHLLKELYSYATHPQIVLLCNTKKYCMCCRNGTFLNALLDLLNIYSVSTNVNCVYFEILIRRVWWINTLMVVLNANFWAGFSCSCRPLNIQYILSSVPWSGSISVLFYSPGRIPPTQCYAGLRLPPPPPPPPGFCKAKISWAR